MERQIANWVERYSSFNIQQLASEMGMILVELKEEGVRAGVVWKAEWTIEEANDHGYSEQEQELLLLIGLSLGKYKQAEEQGEDAEYYVSLYSAQEYFGMEDDEFEQVVGGMVLLAVEKKLLRRNR